MDSYEELIRRYVESPVENFYSAPEVVAQIELPEDMRYLPVQDAVRRTASAIGKVPEIIADGHCQVLAGMIRENQVGLVDPDRFLTITLPTASVIDLGAAVMRYPRLRNAPCGLLIGRAHFDAFALRVGIRVVSRRQENGLEVGGKPMATTERNSLLTIIAALCRHSGIDHQGRGAAAQIARLTDGLGAAVSADTVGRALEKIPDALESRMK